MQVLGIDVGGTKVEIASVLDGRALAPQRAPTPLDDTDALLDAIEALARKVIEQDGQPGAIGVGVPSQIDFATGTVVSSVNIPLEGVPLKTELEDRFGIPVFVDNDANCAAQAEAELVRRDGGGAEGGPPERGPAKHLLMLTLGTGVGGGAIIDGHVFRGATGLGAEMGHMVIEADGRKCPGRTCPNRGCIEAYCSGTGFERANGRSGSEAAEAARSGDAKARDEFQDFGRWLGVGIASFVNMFEPEWIVIGGGFGAANYDLFIDTAIEEARSRALPAGFERVTVSLAKGGSDAGAIGAGVMALKEHALATSERDTARTSTLGGDR